MSPAAVGAGRSGRRGECAVAWPARVPAVVIVAVTASSGSRCSPRGRSLFLGVVTSSEQLDGERSLTARMSRAFKAVMHQRFSFVPVVALFVLSVPSGAAILEQLPDVLRRWISDGGLGARQAILAMLSTLGLGAFLIVAGWYRSGHAFRHPKPDPAAERIHPTVRRRASPRPTCGSGWWARSSPWPERSSPWSPARRGHPRRAARRVRPASRSRDHRVGAAPPPLARATRTSTEPTTRGPSTSGS